MSTTTIEWTEKTWNPVRGCSLISEGCRNCYAMKFAHRFSKEGKPYEGLTKLSKNSGPVWTGEVRFVPEQLGAPLHVKEPRKIFVNSMSDLFHEKVTNEQIAAVFGVMASAPRHTFQVLTKRADRMREWFSWIQRRAPETLTPELVICFREALQLGAVKEEHDPSRDCRWPLRNVWLGVSVENQKAADERIPDLLAIPAAVRWLSVEPLLGPVDLSKWLGGDVAMNPILEPAPIDWVVVGGESGPGAREMNPEWARSIRDQCVAARVPFFFKQWGTWVDVDQAPDATVAMIDAAVNLAGNPQQVFGVGKKRAGRLLDGRTWDEYPR